ncbi:MAG: T9SS type A sorting domain-containing protein [candidate division KSB1 bacterium]|nr:T9SS type A sorting domain-containing protein [candidate division KSB1 bacterium]
MLKEKNGRYWTYQPQAVLSNREPVYISIPLDQFTASDTATQIDLENLNELAFNVLPGIGGSGLGVIVLDSILFSTGLSTGVKEKPAIVPDDFYLSPVYPNPFNASTRMTYRLPKSGLLKISVMNVRGQTVKLLVKEYQNAGVHNLVWNAENAETGVYFIRLQTKDKTLSKKCLLLK